MRFLYPTIVANTTIKQQSISQKTMQHLDEALKVALLRKL